MRPFSPALLQTLIENWIQMTCTFTPCSYASYYLYLITDIISAISHNYMHIGHIMSFICWLYTKISNKSHRSIVTAPYPEACTDSASHIKFVSRRHYQDVLNISCNSCTIASIRRHVSSAQGRHLA